MEEAGYQFPMLSIVWIAIVEHEASWIVAQNQEWVGGLGKSNLVAA
jgi:hypothetical protein